MGVRIGFKVGGGSYSTFKTFGSHLTLGGISTPDSPLHSTRFYFSHMYLHPNIPAPMVQEFELRDLQFEAGSINDNYRVFILPCCKIVHSSLEISLEEFLFYGIS